MHRREFVAGAIAPGVSRSLQAPVPFHAGGQVDRRRQIYALHRRSAAPLFDPLGRWVAKSTAPARREMLWNAMSFLSSEDTRALGNAVIRQMFIRPRERDHFVHIAAVQILLRDKGELEPAVRDGLADLVHAAMKQDGEHPIRFMGYNDNFPAMDTAYAVLGGRVLDYAPARRRGRDALDRAADLLRRRGLFSEYTSPTYSPVTLLCYAEIAEFAESAEERQLAGAIERRVWLDIATHWHAPTNILAGPHSRAYTVDRVGHCHQVQMVLFHVFGDSLWMTPLRYMFPPVEGQVIHHDGDVPFMQVSNVWMASATYHPDSHIRRILFEKPFPYRVTATSEFGATRAPIIIRSENAQEGFIKSGELFEYPSGELVSTTYMTEKYAVGTATAQYGDGNQSDAFFVNFVRVTPAASLRDISTIYCRYVTNDHRLGEPWVNPARPDDGPSRDFFGDGGRVRAIQKDGTALVVYQAKGQILDVFWSMRLTIIIPVFYRPLKRILVGDQDVTSRLPFNAVEPRIVWIEDDILFAAFRPLGLSNHGRPYAIRIAEENGYVGISFYNYEGPPKRFARAQLHETLNGFVAEFASSSECRFADFRRLVLSGKLTDEVFAGQRVTDYRRDGLHLGLSHSLYYDGLKYALIDGQPIGRPMLEATGLDPVLLRL